MLGPARRNDDAAKAVSLQSPRNLPRGIPKKFGVFESLAGDDHVRAVRRDLQKNFGLSKGRAGTDPARVAGRNPPPIVRIAQHDVHVRSRREIEADIFPRRQPEEWTVTAVNVLAAEIEDDERFRATRFQ